MAKQRSIARRPREAAEHRHPETESNVRALFGWSPLGHGDGEDDGRDQRFVRTIKPRSAGQEQLIEAINAKPLVCALGPAGTGKTYLAIAKAVEALEAGRVSRIVLSRPAVEAGESIGFLPGHMEDKLAPAATATKGTLLFNALLMGKSRAQRHLIIQPGHKIFLTNEGDKEAFRRFRNKRGYQSCKG